LVSKILNIILAIILFLSSAGLLVNKHYCQDELKNVAIFVEAKSCHEQQEQAVCPHHQKAETEEEKNNCCENESEFLKLDQDLQVENFDFASLKKPLQLAVVMIALTIELPSTESTNPHYLSYKPPIVCDDLPVVLQSFLL